MVCLIADFAVYMCGVRSGTFWTIASLATIAGFALADALGFVCPNVMNPVSFRILKLLALAGLVACVHVLVLVLTRFEHGGQKILHKANSRLEVQSALDGLTGIANRRSFETTLETEWKRHERIQLPLSLVLIDVDWFKQYNDSYGHLAGDDVLRSIARACKRASAGPATW